MPLSTDVPVCIGPYMTERLVGRGAMAAVYLCRAPGGAPVAVKWMDLCLPGAGPQDGSFTPPLLARFEREVRSLSKLDHPNVVRYRGHGLWQGRPYLVMDHVEGSDLRVYTDKLAQRPPVERYARARTIGQSLCEAAGALHAVGLVHRDIKPGNVLVDPDGRVVLSDLGVVKDLQETKQTLVGVVVGTIAYAAPEQLDGDEVDPRTDLYGIGATLYYLLTGHRPFEGKGRLPGQPVPPPSRWDPELPTELEAVVLRLMAPRPSDRFPDTQTAAAALASARDGGGGLTLAGRGKVVRRMTECLDRVESEHGSVLIQIAGPMGVGRSWLAGVVRAAGSRRGLTVLEPGDSAAAKVAVARAAAQPGIVVLTRAAVQVLPGLSLCRATLEPLSVADVRRTLVAAAPLTLAPARKAERLHRWTGGLPALLTPLLQAHTHGARLELPRDPTPGPAVDRYMAGLDLDAVEVLGALAGLGGAADLHTIQVVARLPPELSLEQLQSRGMVREVDGLYSLTAQQFALAAWARQADPEGLRQRATAAIGDRPTPALGPSPEDIALGGDLAKALRAARRWVADAQARGDRSSEVLALCSCGQVQLDVGLFEGARRSLADASALAKAGDNTTLGRQAHVMRSRAQLHGLDSRQARARSSAAAALDRVVPLASGAGQRRSAQDAQIFAAWAWAAAVLGDSRASHQAAERALQRLDLLAGGPRLRCCVVLAWGAIARGDRQGLYEAAALLDQHGVAPPLLAWQIARLVAGAEGRALPPVGTLADGLSPDEAAALDASCAPRAITTI